MKLLIILLKKKIFLFYFKNVKNNIITLHKILAYLGTF